MVDRRPISATQLTISSQLILTSTTYPKKQARTEALWELPRIAVVTRMTAKGGPRLWHSFWEVSSLMVATCKACRSNFERLFFARVEGE